MTQTGFDESKIQFNYLARNLQIDFSQRIESYFLMTIQKAIQILDWILNNKTKTIEEFYKPNIIDSKYDLSENLYRTLLEIAKTDVYNLEVVKKQLVPDCKHPKRMQDICGGQKYCMNCNMDL